MNVVSDSQVIIAIQGIRNVTWGEGDNSYARHRGRFFVTIAYKNGNNTFYYATEPEAKGLFVKIQDAMHATRKRPEVPA